MIGFFIIVALLIIGGLWMWFGYSRWLQQQTKRVSADSRIVETARGQVEYDMRGAGEVILHFHGGNVGHNGWFMLAHLVEAGYTVLTPDRPGYLGTPLPTDASPESQADLFAALLDKLDIKSVAVAGVSAGGPGALMFAIKYPERTKALILLSAITKQTGLSDDQLNSTLGKLVMSPKAQNISYFFINQAMKKMPGLALADYVRTETTYDSKTGKQYIEQILNDPPQKLQVMALADAIVPALPRFEGVMNDLAVQQTLADLPLEKIKAPTLIVHSKHDGDVPYENATHAAGQIPDAELITVEQFGHRIWWGDASVTQEFQQRIEVFLQHHLP